LNKIKATAEQKTKVTNLQQQIYGKRKRASATAEERKTMNKCT